MRQIEELEAKVNAGAVVPSEEQREKMGRKSALMAELAEVRRRASVASCLVLDSGAHGYQE